MPRVTYPSIQRGGIIIILLIGLLLRLGWGLTRDNSQRGLGLLPDQVEYLALAHSVLHGQGLRFFDDRFGSWSYAYRTPGYPLFIAACGADPRAVRAAQAVLDTLTILAIYLLARRLLPAATMEAGPLVAALVVALNPFLIYFSGLILSETLFAAMLAWGMYFLAASRVTQGGTESWRNASGSSAYLPGVIILALSVLVRPSAIPLPILLVMGTAFLNRGEGAAYQGQRLFKMGSATVLLLGLVLFPWAWRNRNVLGEWVWTTTNGGITAYDGFNANATGASDQSFVKRHAAAAQHGRATAIEVPFGSGVALFSRTP